MAFVTSPFLAPPRTFRAHLMSFPEFHIQLMRIDPVASRQLSTLQETERLKDSQALLPFDCSFEEALEQLDRLPRLLIEPDGSFVWTGEQASQRWQIDGMVYDRQLIQEGSAVNRVAWCDIKGSCPYSEWQQLLRCFGTAEELLVAYLQHAGQFVSIHDLFQLWNRAS